MIREPRHSDGVFDPLGRALLNHPPEARPETEIFRLNLGELRDEQFKRQTSHARIRMTTRSDKGNFRQANLTTGSTGTIPQTFPRIGPFQVQVTLIETARNIICGELSRRRPHTCIHSPPG